MIHDQLENAHRYPLGPAWEKAVAFLKSLGPDTPEEDYIPLDGDAMFARVMVYPTRGPEGAVLEAHDRYVDVQMSLDGAEAIEWFSRPELAIQTPYDSEKDVVFFERPGPGRARVENHPGAFTLLFPEDAHMAQLIVRAEAAPVKKVVVKIDVDHLHNKGLS